jgi:hypothetical protein
MADADAAVQAVRAQGSAEVKHYVATISQLRAELEAQRDQAERALDETRREASRERLTLQNQIQAMRSELERAS